MGCFVIRDLARSVKFILVGMEIYLCDLIVVVDAGGREEPLSYWSLTSSHIEKSLYMKWMVLS